MSNELLELVGFLNAEQNSVRLLAAENLVGYSQGQHTYIFKGNDYAPVKDLKQLLKDKDYRTVQYALKILINLCDDRTILDMLAADENFVQQIANSITDLRLVNADLFCILLANLAKNDSVTVIFGMDRKKPETHGLTENEAALAGEGAKPAEQAEKEKHQAQEPIDDSEIFTSSKLMDCLMDCFVKGSDRSLNKYADFSYLSYFFSDISRFKKGRDYFINSQSYDNVVPVTKLLVFTEHPSKVRREGVVSTIKNSLFDIESHEKFIKDQSINLLPYILLPLADGSDEYREDEMFELPEELQLLPPDKKRESSPQILTILVECFLLLCTTRSMRGFLREKNIYPVIRELHKKVDDEVLKDTCERLVQVLMRDEDPENEEKPKITEVNGEDEEENDDDDDEIVEVV